MQNKHTNVIRKLTHIVVKKVAAYKVVYRLEHPKYNNIGPFRCGQLYSHATLQHLIERCFNDEWEYTHPTPEWEGISDEVIQKCLCACATYEQLKSWFGEFIRPLIEIEGFVLARYYVRVTGTHYTATQVLIEPNKVIKKVIVKHLPASL